MKLESARYEGGELIFSTTDPEARRVAYKFKAGEYELVRRKPRRSLDANAYAWALIDKLAAATNLSKVEVYREAIRDIGGVSEVVCVRTGRWTGCAAAGNTRASAGRLRRSRARYRAAPMWCCITARPCTTRSR